jgi:hypothetical protein
MEAQADSLLSAGYNIPIANLSDPTSETTIVYLLAVIDDGSIREEFPQIPNSWHTLLRRTAGTALDTLRHRIAGPLPSLARTTAHSPATDRGGPSPQPA